MEFETLKLSRDQNTMWVIVNRPQALNALNKQVMTDLGQAAEALAADRTLRCVIVTGEGGKAFVAGADIKEMADFKSSQALELSQRGHKIFDRLAHLHCPVVAAVNGFTLGGGFELALACDFIVCTKTSQFGLPEVGLGLIPGYGGTQRLAQVVGKNWARYLALTGQVIKADVAERIGLAVAVWENEEFNTKLTELSRTIESRGPLAVALAKQAVHQGCDLPLNKGLELEARLFSESFATEDHTEGLQAFIGKRKPQFMGK